MTFIQKLRLILCLFLIVCQQYVSQAQLPVTNNSAEIYMQLKKLNVLASVLYIAAHPDDENNGFLPYLAKEKLYRTGYLSLTRGDGGQNLIGSEQGIELGLIRTQELLAARRQDGSEQFFSRAYEFGFCKNPEEALRIWDKEKILSDVVWIIRQYQPDVIITRFPGDARAGHGHHSASSLLANEAYKAAADPNRFPEQFAFGVKAWQAKRIVWNTFNFGGTNTTSNDQFSLDVSGYNPLLGKSYGEIGGEARSMHKSQGEGRPRRRGPSMEYFLTTGGEAPKNELTDGVITDWKRLEGGSKIQEMVNELIKNYRFEQPEASVPALVNVYKAIKQLAPSNWRNKKLTEVQQLIESCSALFVEATTNQESVVPGDVLAVNFFLNKRKQVNATLKTIKLEKIDTALNVNLAANQNLQFSKTILIDGNKKISQPYWLEYPKLEGSFDVRDQQLIGKAENDPAFSTEFLINIEGEDFLFNKPVQYKVVDPAKGELYQPLVVLPRTEINFNKENYVSMNGGNTSVGLHRKKNTADSTVSVFSIIGKKDFQTVNYSGSNNEINDVDLNMVFKPIAKTDNYKEELGIQSKNAGVYTGSTKIISYDHIPTITYFSPAKTNLIKLSVKTEGKKVGYIVGAGDKVPQALEQLGYEVTYLSEADINFENLKQFDAIITGIRAYNIYEYLTNKNGILNRYVENGGNLIIQYLKSNQVGLKRVKVGPYPFIVNAGSRVTEENAAVNFLLPQHPVLNYPNPITQKDFEGWVQERSTYQAEQLDSHFEAPLSMNDTSEKPANGSLITAKFGKGNIAYVSLVLFRQLPAGIPGAYRILANLIALPKNK